MIIVVVVVFAAAGSVGSSTGCGGGRYGRVGSGSSMIGWNLFFQGFGQFIPIVILIIIVVVVVLLLLLVDGCRSGWK